MKKIIIASALLTLISLSAFAKTAGNYIGVNLINTNLQLDSARYIDGSRVNYHNSDRGNGNRVSISGNYKYAFNFNNFFIAPALFAEYSDASLKSTANNKFTLEYRYGAKLDFGYDLSSNFAGYLSFGIARNHNKYYLVSNNQTLSHDNDAPLYGVGVKYSFTKNMDLNAEYERTTTSFKFPSGYNLKKASYDVNIFRIGVSYNF